MADIKTIPDNELEKDLSDSIKDIHTCLIALTAGITKYSTGSVQERLNKNKQFIITIEAEIERRKNIKNAKM